MHPPRRREGEFAVEEVCCGWGCGAASTGIAITSTMGAGGPTRTAGSVGGEVSAAAALSLAVADVHRCPRRQSGQRC